MKRAVNYLRGTATLTARGLFPERLLNLCAQEGVACWALEWTDSRPKVPGWYWFRNGGAKPVILPITLPVRWKVEPDDEWAGPIPEPREPKQWVAIKNAEEPCPKN